MSEVPPGLKSGLESISGRLDAIEARLNTVTTSTDRQSLAVIGMAERLSHVQHSPRTYQPSLGLVVWLGLVSISSIVSFSFTWSLFGPL